MDEQFAVYSYNGILHSDEKEWTTYLCHNMNESQNDYAELMKPGTKSTYGMVPFI